MFDGDEDHPHRRAGVSSVGMSEADHARVTFEAGARREPFITVRVRARSRS
jgi:hypothetical protein